MSGKSWDKLILLVVGLVVVGVSALFSMRALGFADQFEMSSSSPKDDLPETPQQIAEIAKSFVEKTQAWTNSSKGVGNTAVPLFVSVPLVEKDGVVINMIEPGGPQVRPPVTNEWLMAHNLDFLNAGVLSQDQDNDGFTSIAEWEAKTSPIDPASHPPYASKLIYASQQKESYIVKFAARPDPERFQIIRIETRKWPRDTYLMRAGDVSEDQQFRIESFEERKAQNAAGIMADASVVKITYLPKNEVVELIKGIDTPIPTFFAEMKFELDPAFQQYVKEGEAFTLTMDPGTKYRVVKAGDTSVTIAYQIGTEPEQTIEIPKK